MNFNIAINQQPSSLPASDRPAPEKKVKDPERRRRGKKSQVTMKKLREKANDLKRIYRLFYYERRTQY